MLNLSGDENKNPPEPALPQPVPENAPPTDNEEPKPQKTPVDQSSGQVEAAKKAQSKETLLPQVTQGKLAVLFSSESKMKDEILTFLSNLILTPVLVKLDEAVSLTQTGLIPSLCEVDLALVILTADDCAYPNNKGGKPAQSTQQSHQRAIFYLGYLIGKMGRDKVLAFYSEHKSFRLPSWYFDAQYIDMTSFSDRGQGQEWKSTLLSSLMQGPFRF